MSLRAYLAANDIFDWQLSTKSSSILSKVDDLEFINTYQSHLLIFLQKIEPEKLGMNTDDYTLLFKNILINQLNNKNYNVQSEISYFELYQKNNWEPKWDLLADHYYHVISNVDLSNVASFDQQDLDQYTELMNWYVDNQYADLSILSQEQKEKLKEKLLEVAVLEDVRHSSNSEKYYELVSKIN
jgi:hypothetical protein